MGRRKKAKGRQASDDSTVEAEAPLIKVPRGLTLHNDERISFMARPSRGANMHKYLYTLGLYGVWRKRNTWVITNRRILIGRGLVHREERSIPFNRVEDVRFVRRGLNSYAQMAVNDRGSVRTARVGPLGPRAARRFAIEILDRLS